MSLSSICFSFVGGLRAPNDETQTNYVGLVVIDAVHPDYLFAVFQLERPRLTLFESSFNLEECLHVFVVHFNRLHVL